MLVVTGARVWNPSRGGGDPAEPRAVWINGDRIVEVTPVDAAPAPGARADITVLSYPGRFVLPAFVDAHFHLMSLANKSLRRDLSSARDAADVVSLLAAEASARRDDGAVVGVDFDESDWRDGLLPTRASLNAVSRTRPLYARRVCCHVGVANDALLALLQSPERFVDRASGRIVEEAVFEANRLTRPPAADQVLAIDGAIAHLHSLGVTAIHDIVDAESLDVYVEGLQTSRRPLRVDAYLHVAARDFDAARSRLRALSGRGVRAMGIKIFADGSLGGRTAALNAPYADGGATGDLLVTPAALRAELEACVRMGAACAVHAIGDRALGAVLDAMDSVTRAAGPARFRIEHAEVIGPPELERCARLRVPLVMQPNFVRNWGGEGGMYAQRLGPERWGRNNPFATLSRHDVPVVFSSDVMPAGPLFGIRGATRHAVAGERIGTGEAFYRYTRAAADVFGSWEEATAGPEAGRIEPGARADLIVIPAHPLLADPDRLRVEATIADGAEVYRAEPAARPMKHSKRRR